MGDPQAGEQDLVSRCRAGDEVAWAELVERYARYIHAICVRGFRLDQHDAEDVFQEVFAKAYQQLHRLRDDGAMRPWLAQLTRRACIDRMRDGARETPLEEIDAGVDDVLATLDEAIAVREALLGLGEPCSEILDRFFARDESYRTIGEQLNLPAGTIASRISRCLEKLRVAMEDSAVLARPEDE